MEDKFDISIRRPIVTDKGTVALTTDHYTYPIPTDINGDHDYDQALDNALMWTLSMRYHSFCEYSIHLGPQLVAAPEYRIHLGRERTYVPRPTTLTYR